MKTAISKNLCPICGFDQAGNLLDLDCGNWDHSALYPSVKIAVCRKCGHVFNKLTSAEAVGLAGYYNREYAPSNLDSADDIGDRPGSCNVLTRNRYDQLWRFIAPYLKDYSQILDVGCAGGGFLNFLRQKGFSNLFGIDPTKKYLHHAKKKNGGQIKLGSAESIPFEDRTMNILVLDQVVEHLVDPRRVFQEAKRVLTDEGLLCISVPDAFRYGQKYFFDFFWFLVREHIQHFDLEHLKLAAALEGFKPLAEAKSELPMVSEKMILPVMNVLFRFTKAALRLAVNPSHFKLKTRLVGLITEDKKRIDKKRRAINCLVGSRRPVYAWGIGREFLYFYEVVGLKKCNLAGLIDLNPFKQKKITVGGRKIVGPSVLKKAAPDSVLVISAVAHAKSIKQEVRKMGYRGQILNI